MTCVFYESRVTSPSQVSSQLFTSPSQVPSLYLCNLSATRVQDADSSFHLWLGATFSFEMFCEYGPSWILTLIVKSFFVFYTAFISARSGFHVMVLIFCLVSWISLFACVLTLYGTVLPPGNTTYFSFFFFL